MAWLLSTVQALAGANLCAAQSPASLQALPNVCLLASPGEGGSQAAGKRRSQSRAAAPCCSMPCASRQSQAEPPSWGVGECCSPAPVWEGEPRPPPTASKATG